jgi:hypothetical protein
LVIRTIKPTKRHVPVSNSKLPTVGRPSSKLFPDLRLCAFEAVNPETHRNAKTFPHCHWLDGEIVKSAKNDDFVPTSRSLAMMEVIAPWISTSQQLAVFHPSIPQGKTGCNSADSDASLPSSSKPLHPAHFRPPNYE